MGDERLLIDAGISLKKLKKRLKEINEPSIFDINGVLISHEHFDHTRGIKALTKKYQLKYWLTYDTYQSIRSKTGPIDTEFIEVAESFSIGSIEIIPYEVPHDAADPIAFVLTKDDKRIGILLDCGKTSPYLIDGFRGLDILIIESNHSFDRILASNYPEYLKKRILSSNGHLSNYHAGEFLALTQPKLAIITHLSENNNTLEQALSEVEEVFTSHKRLKKPFLVFTPSDSRSALIHSD
jgi:phosphoribosyl 1,2-cyclic phosphodiesterase